MKFVRYALNQHGLPLPGLLDSQGEVRNISALIKDISAEEVMTHLSLLSSHDINTLPSAGKVEALHLFPCVTRPGKIICLALNSKGHAKETGQSLSSEPLFFFKASSSISGPRDPIIYPKIGRMVDWEGELAVVIGRKAKHISSEAALDYVVGYCCINDISERQWQFEPLGQKYSKGKSFDSFAPIGPYLVTKDEIANPQHLQITLKVNGNLRQQFSTDDYQFGVQEAISFLSQLFTLEPGDIIAMGTGPGHAKEWNNAYLTIGDQVELEIEHLGKQQQVVIAEP